MRQFSIGVDTVTFASGKVTVPHSAQLNMSGDYTIEAYLKWTATGAYKAFEKVNASSVGPSVMPNWVGSAYNPGQITIAESTATAHRLGSAATGLNDGQWRLYDFVRRGGTRRSGSMGCATVP